MLQNTNHSIDYQEASKDNAYNALCRQLSCAATNNDFITLSDGFKSLGIYKDSVLKRKQCLDSLTFNTAEELLYLGRCYQELNLSDCKTLAEKCIETANQWQEYNKTYKAFYSKYDSKPILKTLWDKFSTIIIIAGIVTLLWGFIIYGGALLLEWIIRSIVTKVKRNSDEFKTQSKNISMQKQLLDRELQTLRNRKSQTIL